MDVTGRKLNEKTVVIVKDVLNMLVKTQAIPHEQMIEVLNLLKKKTTAVQSIIAERLITKKEAAETLGYRSTKTIDRMEKEGTIDRVQIGNGQVRFRQSDISRLMGVPC